MKKGSQMLVYALILAAVGLRFLPHIPNFTPVGAVLLLAAAVLPAKRLWFPLAAIIGSDFLLTGVVLHAAPRADQYLTWAGWCVYLGLGLTLRHRARVARVAGTTLLGSAGFFLLSNLGVWAAGALYPRTWAGVAACFTAAIPFGLRTAAGDLTFAAVVFGLYAGAQALARQRALARAAA